MDKGYEVYNGPEIIDNCIKIDCTNKGEKCKICDTGLKNYVKAAIICGNVYPRFTGEPTEKPVQGFIKNITVK